MEEEGRIYYSRFCIRTDSVYAILSVKPLIQTRGFNLWNKNEKRGALSELKSVQCFFLTLVFRFSGLLKPHPKKSFEDHTYDIFRFFPIFLKLWKRQKHKKLRAKLETNQKKGLMGTYFCIDYPEPTQSIIFPNR